MIQTGVYRHYKNKKLYRVLMGGTYVGNDQTGQPSVVIYIPLYNCPGNPVFVRPESEFKEVLPHPKPEEASSRLAVVNRFEFIHE